MDKQSSSSLFAARGRSLRSRISSRTCTNRSAMSLRKAPFLGECHDKKGVEGCGPSQQASHLQKEVQRQLLSSSVRLLPTQAPHAVEAVVLH